MDYSTLSTAALIDTLRADGSLTAREIVLLERLCDALAEVDDLSDALHRLGAEIQLQAAETLNDDGHP